MADRTWSVGDRVRIGAGGKEWVIVGFGTWQGSGDEYAELEPVTGYTRGTATLDRLTLVEAVHHG